MPFRQALPGYTLHAWRALANALFARRRQALLFTPGEHSPTLSSPGTDRGYHLRPESARQCSHCQVLSGRVLLASGDHSLMCSSPGSARGYHQRPEGTRQCSHHQAPSNVWRHHECSRKCFQSTHQCSLSYQSIRSNTTQGEATPHLDLFELIRFRQRLGRHHQSLK
jgi:hypothetical protein